MDREKLCKAINLGYIGITMDADGTVKYVLTKQGLEQWKKEMYPNVYWQDHMFRGAKDGEQ